MDQSLESASWAGNNIPWWPSVCPLSPHETCWRLLVLHPLRLIRRKSLARYCRVWGREEGVKIYRNNKERAGALRNFSSSQELEMRLKQYICDMGSNCKGTFVILLLKGWATPYKAPGWLQARRDSWDRKVHNYAKQRRCHSNPSWDRIK